MLYIELDAYKKAKSLLDGLATFEPHNMALPAVDITPVDGFTEDDIKDILSSRQIQYFTENFDFKVQDSLNEADGDNTTGGEEYKGIFIDRKTGNFKILTGRFPDKKAMIRKYGVLGKGYIVRKVFERSVFDWINKNAQNAIEAYLMFSTAFSKWKDIDILQKYYTKLIDELPQLFKNVRNADVITQKQTNKTKNPTAQKTKTNDQESIQEADDLSASEKHDYVINNATNDDSVVVSGLLKDQKYKTFTVIRREYYNNLGQLIENNELAIKYRAEITDDNVDLLHKKYFDKQLLKELSEAFFNKKDENIEKIVVYWKPDAGRDSRRQRFINLGADRVSHEDVKTYLASDFLNSSYIVYDDKSDDNYGLKTYNNQLGDFMRSYDNLKHNYFYTSDIPTFDFSTTNDPQEFYGRWYFYYDEKEMLPDIPTLNPTYNQANISNIPPAIIKASFLGALNCPDFLYSFFQNNRLNLLTNADGKDQKEQNLIEQRNNEVRNILNQHFLDYKVNREFAKFDDIFGLFKDSQEFIQQMKKIQKKDWSAGQYKNLLPESLQNKCLGLFKQYLQKQLKTNNQSIKTYVNDYAQILDDAFFRDIAKYALCIISLYNLCNDKSILKQLNAKFQNNDQQGEKSEIDAIDEFQTTSMNIFENPNMTNKQKVQYAKSLINSQLFAKYRKQFQDKIKDHKKTLFVPNEEEEQQDGEATKASIIERLDEIVSGLNIINLKSFVNSIKIIKDYLQDIGTNDKGEYQYYNIEIGDQTAKEYTKDNSTFDQNTTDIVLPNYGSFTKEAAQDVLQKEIQNIKNNLKVTPISDGKTTSLEDDWINFIKDLIHSYFVDMKEKKEYELKHPKNIYGLSDEALSIIYNVIEPQNNQNNYYLGQIEEKYKKLLDLPKLVKYENNNFILSDKQQISQFDVLDLCKEYKMFLYDIFGQDKTTENIIENISSKIKRLPDNIKDTICDNTVAFRMYITSEKQKQNYDLMNNKNEYENTKEYLDFVSKFLGYVLYNDEEYDIDFMSLDLDGKTRKQLFLQLFKVYFENNINNCGDIFINKYYDKTTKDRKFKFINYHTNQEEEYHIEDDKAIVSSVEFLQKYIRNNYLTYDVFKFFLNKLTDWMHLYGDQLGTNLNSVYRIYRKKGHLMVNKMTNDIKQYINQEFRILLDRVPRGENIQMDSVLNNFTNKGEFVKYLLSAFSTVPNMKNNIMFELFDNRRDLENFMLMYIDPNYFNSKENQKPRHVFFAQRQRLEKIFNQTLSQGEDRLCNRNTAYDVLSKLYTSDTKEGKILHLKGGNKNKNRTKFCDVIGQYANINNLITPENKDLYDPTKEVYYKRMSENLDKINSEINTYMSQIRLDDIYEDPKNKNGIYNIKSIGKSDIEAWQKANEQFMNGKDGTISSSNAYSALTPVLSELLDIFAKSYKLKSSQKQTYDMSYGRQMRTKNQNVHHTIGDILDPQDKEKLSRLK